MSEKNGKKSSKKVVISIIAAAVVVAIVAIFIVSTTAKTEYQIESNVLKLTGSYGAEIDLNEASVEMLTDAKLTITKRNNGSSVGGKSKGKFTISDNGVDKVVYLNLMNNNTNFYIKIVDKEKKEYFINCTNLEETQELYERIIVVN